MIKNLTIQRNMVCLTESEFDRLLKAVEQAEKIKDKLRRIVESAEASQMDTDSGMPEFCVLDKLHDFLTELGD